MSNRVRLILFSVFVLLTFYQFYTYAKSFRLNDFLPQDKPAGTVLFGTFVTQPSTNPLSQVDFAIPLLVINIVLLVEHPNQIGRRPMIFALVANLFILIMHQGFGTPALKQALANLQSNQATFVYPFAQWNALYLTAAIISSLIVIRLLIQILRKQ